GSSGPSGSPGASGGPIQGGNTKEICAAADKIVTEGLSNFLGDYADMMTAQGKGDTAGVDAAKKKAGDEAKSLAGKLREQGGKASASSSPTVDTKANTKEVCTSAEGLLTKETGQQLGEPVGKAIGWQLAGKPAERDAAKAEAVTKINAVVTKIRDLQAKALDPTLRNGLAKFGDEFAKLADLGWIDSVTDLTSGSAAFGDKMSKVADNNPDLDRACS